MTRPNLVVVDAIRNPDGKGMVNIYLPREEAADYPKWSKWNGRIVAAQAKRGEGEL